MTAPNGQILQHYKMQIAQGKLQSDDAQLTAVSALDELAEQLQIVPKWWQKKAYIKGLYLYGPVGRGKSMLMDLFYQQVAIKNKQRLHFHHFMASVHQRLHELQGVKNPLENIAKEWAQRTRLLCFDEFFVSDIGDAMLMAGLFKALFTEGVVLVATSNCAPSSLYKNGLQRARFLPTIDLINDHCKVLNLTGQVDHRFRFGRLYNHYFIQAAPTLLDAHFNAFSLADKHNGSIVLCNRQVAILQQSAQAIMFDFMALCSGPRSTNDYIYLAKHFSRLYISNVPVMGQHATGKQIVHGIEDSYQREKQDLQEHQLDDEARRFIALIDEFYDRGKLVVISAAADIAELYQGKRLAFEYCRTESRLVEMQSW